MEHIKQYDKEIYDLIEKEEHRQQNKLRLIPSENYTSKAVMEATGTCLTNKYSEGYPRKRYYEGQEFIDEIEELAIKRAKDLFRMDHANVQTLSGSPANMAVYLAFLKPYDKIMGLSLPHGGHLTHGWKVSFSGKVYTSIPYSLNKDTMRIDYDEVRSIAKKEKPKLIWAGASAYPRIIDFEIFHSIASEVGAIFACDIAHIAGLVAGGVHPSPAPYADVITTTTHKTLRGPRGALVLCKNEHKLAIDKAVFPGLQGGPHNHTTAAIAIALKEAQSRDFHLYAKKVVSNANILAEKLVEKGYDLVTGGTDNHLILIDLGLKNITGKIAAKALNKAGIVVNANSVPFDKRTPFDPSGIRIGTPAITSQGMGREEMIMLANWMDKIIANPNDEALIEKTQMEISKLSRNFPPPGF